MPVEPTRIPPEQKWQLAQAALADLPYAAEVWNYLFKEAPETFWSASELNELFEEALFLEERYRSVDMAIQDLEFERFLEFVSGLTFRSMSLCDAPENVVVNVSDSRELPVRKLILEQLLPSLQVSLEGALMNYPYDGWDDQLMRKVRNHFDQNPAGIITDNFFHYMGSREQARLAKLIHDVLKHSDGFWVNADVYVKNNKSEHSASPRALHAAATRFDSYVDAAEFFRQQGFLIYDKVRVPAFRLHLHKNPVLQELKSSRAHIDLPFERQTWVLQAM